MVAVANARPTTSHKIKPKKRSAANGAARTTLHGEILEKLRSFVVEGNLGDDQRIPEKQLCETFGISRTPLREALKVLASEGLIELLPNRGARVRSLDREQLRQLFDIMGGLESLAGRLACENITSEEVTEIENIHHQMYGCYLRRDLHRYFELNQMIHEGILRAARNDKLTRAYASVANQLRRMRYSANQTHTRDRWGEAMREHEEMLDALHRRSGSDMGDIMFRHLRNKAIAVIAHLEEIDGVGKQKLAEPA